MAQAMQKLFSQAKVSARTYAVGDRVTTLLGIILDGPDAKPTLEAGQILFILPMPAEREQPLMPGEIDRQRYTRTAVVRWDSGHDELVPLVMEAGSYPLDFESDSN